MTAVPGRLRVEHLDEGLAVGETCPRLSWQLPDGSRRQVAHQLACDTAGETDWVQTEDHLLVPWPWPALGSGQRVRWRVRVRTDAGVSGWSEPAVFETGLLSPADWRATWLEPGHQPAGDPGTRPAALLRFEFALDRPVVAARLHATARGTYEAFVNGTRAGDVELAPGFTAYDHHLQVQTLDVTGSVRAGRNALAVVLADGWFRGQIGYTRQADQWGDRIAVLAQLHLEHADGTTTVVGTGPGWRSTTGHVTAADLIAGETVDLRLLPRGWDAPGFDDSGWDDAVPACAGTAELVGSPSPPVRRVQELVPVSVTRLDAERQLVDLGQNINGWVRLTDLGPAGTALTLTHGEWLGADGDVTTAHLRPGSQVGGDPLPAGQVDRVISAGVPGDAFEPRRTTHGFQYVRIEGHPGTLTVDDVRGVVVHSDLRRTGWFSCSDDRLDRLHSAAVWSLRDNVCDIPTDCPHRERAGWTGDWQLYLPTAAYLYDVAGFSTKWLRDVVADQWPDGTIANISPSGRSEGRDSPVAFIHGSAGWGDAIVIAPWELYRAYGDLAVLAQTWPAMVRWLDRTQRMAAGGRHPDRVARSAEPAPHETYLWDTGFHFGEWLVPGEDPDDLAAFAAADKADVATAYYARSAELMARTAAVLGRSDDAARYAELAGRVRDAWRTEFLDARGRLTPDTQANHVRALAFHLVPDAHRAAVADRLVELIRAADTHLGTGFLVTPDLLPVLADTGHLDIAYELLLRDTEPSWLTMVDRGATTVWERWDGVSADGVAHESLNHYSKGAVVSFLHRYTAGLRADDKVPAHRRFRVRPRPGGGLTRAAAALETPRGRIEVDWAVEGDRFRLHVRVPAGTSAEIVLPDGTTTDAGPGDHDLDCSLPSDLPVPERTPRVR